MANKVVEVQRLLAEGYELDEVESEAGIIEARFRRGTHTRSITFSPHDAEALLLLRWPRRSEARS